MIKMKVTSNINFESLKRQFSQEIEEVMKQTGEEIVEDMKQKVPVKTGRLRDSIRCETVRSGNTVTTKIIADAKSDGFHAEGVDIEPTPYAQFVERGTEGTWYYPVKEIDSKGVEHVRWVETHGQAANPFLEPAVDEGIKNIGEKLSEAIKKAVKG
jgi:HK97 gp10 family phage protein